MPPGTHSREFGRLVENLVSRELTKLAHNRTTRDVRFARGWVVPDYGTRSYPRASARNAGGVNTAGVPRFDIICYHGDVAWRAHDGMPHALVPRSLARGVVEVKRTLNPTRLHEGTSADVEPVNEQLQRQRRHLESLEASTPLVLVGAHYWDGSETEVRDGARADEVALIGSLTRKGSAAGMATEGELESILDRLLPTGT